MGRLNGLSQDYHDKASFSQRQCHPHSHLELSPLRLQPVLRSSLPVPLSISSAENGPRGVDWNNGIVE